MKPKRFSIVPINTFQLAAAKAIADVEIKLIFGRKVGIYPYAQALFHCFGCQGRIKIEDLQLAIPYITLIKKRGLTKKRCLQVLDTFIKSRGEICCFPLSSKAVNDYFPEVAFRRLERSNRHWEMRFLQLNRIEAKNQSQKISHHFVTIAQARIDLAFIHPSQLLLWYEKQQNQGVFDDDLIDIVHEWSQKFIGLDTNIFISGKPLWLIVRHIKKRSNIEMWLDTFLLPNKLEHQTTNVE